MASSLLLYSNQIWRERVVEPQKRNKDGMRWIIHRFPIKNGISRREMWMRDLSAPCPWFERMIKRG